MQRSPVAQGCPHDSVVQPFETVPQTRAPQAFARGVQAPHTFATPPPPQLCPLLQLPGEQLTGVQPGTDSVPQFLPRQSSVWLGQGPQRFATPPTPQPSPLGQPGHTMGPQAVLTAPHTPGVQTSAIVGHGWHAWLLHDCPVGQVPQRTFLQPSNRSPHCQAASPEAFGSGFAQVRVGVQVAQTLATPPWPQILLLSVSHVPQGAVMPQPMLSVPQFLPCASQLVGLQQAPW